MQKTLQKSFEINDIGLHSGGMVRMVVKPAKADLGIVFQRMDITDRDNIIPARWNNVVDTQLCTVIGNKAGVTVGTIEHLMAALRGCGVDNAIVELDAPEVPVMDGSSAAFVEAIDKVGVVEQESPLRAIRVLKDILVEKDGKRVKLSPSDESLFSGKIVYDHPVIGTQEQELQLRDGNFRDELAEARTFGLLRDVEMMRSAGLALGGSLDNAVVLDDDKVLNEDGLRFDDEFIRHKLLDAIGDLFLAGAPILGAYQGDCAGHAMNNEILHALFADQSNWEWIDISNAQSLPISNEKEAVIA
ncbi:MAG: UDP-3-O-acyl-N-acetylglucosamine deacetylase [Pseudomonadota bacterium]